jgi:hypothetical protein
MAATLLFIDAIYFSLCANVPVTINETRAKRNSFFIVLSLVDFDLFILIF